MAAKILVIDDDNDVRDLLASFLQKEGYSFDMAGPWLRQGILWIRMITASSWSTRTCWVRMEVAKAEWTS